MLNIQKPPHLQKLRSKFNFKLSDEYGTIISKIETKLSPKFERLDELIQFTADFSKWQKETETYISTLHDELDEIMKKNKSFKADIYEKFKSQRKVIGDLSVKITTVFSAMKKMNLVSNEKKESKDNMTLDK